MTKLKPHKIDDKDYRDNQYALRKIEDAILLGLGIIWNYLKENISYCSQVEIYEQ